MIPDMDAVVPGLSGTFGLKVLPMASRAGLPGRAAVTASAQRLVADFTTNISMRGEQGQQWLSWHDDELHQGRAQFTSNKLKEVLGADVLVMRFKDDPQLTSNVRSSVHLNLSLRLMGRFVDELPFDLCRYVLTRGLTVKRFSTSNNVELIGGDISRIGAFFGEQYTVEASLKLYYGEFKGLLSWYLVTLEGGSKSFQADWLAEVDSRLSNKTVMFAGGLDCQFAQGVVNIKIKLWVVNDLVTSGVLGSVV